MNAKNHFEHLKAKSKEQKKKTAQQPSISSSGGLRLAQQTTTEKLLPIKQNQFQPTVATPRMLFDPIKSNYDNTYQPKRDEKQTYQRPDLSHIKSRGTRC